ncbi:hypothetical protein [Hymenobacter elongatus]|nr:hypothetical protein [Hymenobacter elongatus]
MPIFRQTSATATPLSFIAAAEAQAVIPPTPGVVFLILPPALTPSATT